MCIWYLEHKTLHISNVFNPRWDRVAQLLDRAQLVKGFLVVHVCNQRKENVGKNIVAALLVRLEVHVHGRVVVGGVEVADVIPCKGEMKKKKQKKKRKKE